MMCFKVCVRAKVSLFHANEVYDKKKIIYEKEAKKHLKLARKYIELFKRFIAMFTTFINSEQMKEEIKLWFSIEKQIGNHIQLKHPDFKIKLRYTSK